MLLEYAPALSLDKRIEWGRGLAWGGTMLVRFYTACALAALQYLHEVG